MDNSTPTTPFQWNDEKIARVIELDAANVPASKIAEDIGAPTRAVVIGKINRLGLRKIRGDRGNETRKKFGNGAHHTKTPKLKRPTPIRLDIEQLPKGSVSLLDLKACHCRWPVTERPPHMFCGAERWGSSSYCCNHTRMAWRNFEEPQS